MKLLIIDTDGDLIEMLTPWLTTAGFKVFRASSGERARREWEVHQPDLVLVDPTLRDTDGLLVCQQMRFKHDALVLVMTESRDVSDEIRCFEAGADGYLHKPFFPAQLLAYVHALSRRTRVPLKQQPSSVVTVGPLHFDVFHHQVIREKKRVRLTPTEWKLLYFLAVNANTTCTVPQIASSLWEKDQDRGRGLIKHHLHQLRQKIEHDPSHPTLLLTILGKGYMFKYQRDEKESLYSNELAWPLLHPPLLFRQKHA